MKINKILIPFDFSQCAENALLYALEIKEKTGSEICLINISLMPGAYSQTGYYYDDSQLEEIVQVNRDHLIKMKKRIPALYGSQLETKAHITVVDGIKQRVEGGDIDMIVMGTKGLKGLNELLFGSHASQVLKETRIPTLVVPESYREHRLQKVALACDYQEMEDPWETYVLVELCKVFKSKLEIFNVNPLSEPISADQAYQAAQLEDYLKRIQHSYQEIKNKDVEKGIFEYITQHHIDLLTMVPRRHSMLEKLFNASMTGKVVRDVRIPLLVLHDA